MSQRFRGETGVKLDGSEFLDTLGGAPTPKGDTVLGLSIGVPIVIVVVAVVILVAVFLLRGRGRP